jgi:hypothetical protein
MLAAVTLAQRRASTGAARGARMFTTTGVGAFLVAVAAGLGLAHGDAHHTPERRVKRLPDRVGTGHHLVESCRFGPLCHQVYSRHYTKNVLAPAASGAGTSFTAAMTGACTAMGGPPAGFICAAFFGSISGEAVSTISQAAAQNQCADFVTDPTDSVGWFRTDNGPDCHD